jgi:hypothetical protein
MGDREEFGVLLLVGGHFHLGTEGRPVRETHRERRRRKVRGALLRLGLVSTTSLAAFAFASAARAEDQPAPSPLMLGKSAMVVPDQGEAEVESAAAVPVDVVPPSEDEVDAVVPLEPKNPAKPAHKTRARPVRARVVTARHTWRPVIPVSRAAVHAAPKREAVKPVARKAASAGGRWYQVVQAQYRPVEHKVRPRLLAHVSRGEKPVVVSAVTQARSPARTAPIICASEAEKCLESCASDAAYNGSWNGQPIRLCISAFKLRAALAKLRQIVAEGLHLAGTSAQANAAEPRYQCEGAQYHRGICADGAHVAISAASERHAVAGSQLARLVAADTPAEKQPVTENRHPTRLGSVSNAVVRRTQPQSAVKARTPLPAQASSHSGRAAVGQPLHTARADTPSNDWFLRSLLVLMGIAAVAALLAILFEFDAAARAVIALRTRIGSKGLSATHIALRLRKRPPDGIRYRE